MEQWDLSYRPIYLACGKHLLGIYSLRLRWQHTTKQQSYLTCGKSAFVLQLLNYSMAMYVVFKRPRNGLTFCFYL